MSIFARVDQRTQLAGHNRLELLLFQLDSEQLYGINVFKVREVIHCPKLSYVPESHPVVRGIANIRGTTIPVIDLSQAIGLAPLGEPEEKFVVITEYNRSVQAFLVAGVKRIINMNWNEILPPPRGAATNGSYLTAVTRVDEGIVQILDVEKVMYEVMGTRQDVSQELLDDLEDSDERRRVFVVDDSSVARNQIKRTLDHLGFDCVLAKNGREALDMLREWVQDEEVPITERFLMMISDIEMPEMDGYSLTKAVREDERMSDLYVLLHSSLSGVFNESMVKSVGADDFIAKFEPDLLAKTLLGIAEKNGKRAA